MRRRRTPGRGPGVAALLVRGSAVACAGLALADGSYWQFVAPPVEDCELAVEESIWVDGGGKAHPIQQLAIQGMVSRGGGSFSWLLKRMG